jgi:serine/threonine protein kinase
MRQREGDRFGRYLIVSLLGRGGFADTYAAEDTVLRRTVALRIYHRENTSNFMLNEAVACGRLSHPNIPALHDYVEQKDEKGLVFEMLGGRTLNVIGPGRVALQVFADVARALAYSHSKGVIHCDVKPQNVIVDESGKASILDFAAAHIAGLSIRKQGTAIGTPPYMAPEALLGAEPTGAADVFGLAITLFECATGKHPFGEDFDMNQWIQNIMSVHPKICMLRESGIPEQLIEVVEAALAKSPESRPSMTKLSEDLSSVADAFTLPRPPQHRTGAESTVAFTPEVPSPTAVKGLRVFLCHASDDKPVVRKLYRQLVEDGFTPWLDEEDLLPGQDWFSEITRLVRASDVVVVCVSSRAVQKRGFIQKEIRMALDVADEMPEGSVYLIPVKLDACDMPSRLTRWHWVELFAEDGYKRLQRALAWRAKAV